MISLTQPSPPFLCDTYVAIDLTSVTAFAGQQLNPTFSITGISGTSSPTNKIV